MKVIKIDPKTEVSILDVSEDEINLHLGESFHAEVSEDGLIEYLCHELWKVAELEVNNFATMQTKVVFGGLVIARPIAGSDFPEGFMGSENIDLIERTNQDSALSAQISGYYRKNQTRRKFEFDSDDRAIYNGGFFPAIVIAPDSDNQSFDNSENEFRVWIFMKDVESPSLIKSMEHSLAYLMELMIEADELTAAGNPPQFILNTLTRLAN
jgi:hypothetical protein